MAKDIKRHIQLLKSSGATAPAAADLLYGEIAVGYGKDSEALYIKNSNDDVITFLSSSSSASTIAQAVALAELYADSGDVQSVVDDDVVVGVLGEKTATGRTLTLSHASGSTQSGFKKLSSDAYGHITAGTDVALSDLTALGAVSSARTVSGTGILDGGGDLSADRTITHKTNGFGSGTAQGSATGNLAFGDSFDIPSVTFDAYGHITASGKTTLTLPTQSADFITSIEDTSDINLEVTSGKLTATHTNTITAGTAKTSSSTVTVTPSGADIVIPSVEFDTKGHITSAGTASVSLKVNAAGSDTAGVVKIATATGTNNTDTVMTQKAVSDELATKAASANAVASVDYDSTGKTISFKNAAGTEIDSIDTTDFIKDGMVNNVEISGTNLVVTFNTDAGKDPISIPLSSIFDPSNYYQKSETSGKTEISTALSAKADTATTITAGTGLTGGGDLSANRTISLATTGTAGTYAKVVTDNYGRVTSGSATIVTSDISDFSTEMDKKANTATTLAGYNIGDAYTKDELTGSSAVVVAKASSATTAASADNANSAATAAVAESVALADVTNADDLKAIEALEGTSGLLKKTAANAWTLDTNTYLTSAVQNVSLTGGTNNGTLKLTVDGNATDNIQVTGLGGAAYLNTGTTAGTVAAGDHTHSEYANQNAFSNVKVGSSTIEADSATDTIEFAAAENSGLSISADTTNDKVTFDLGDIVCGDYA